MPETTKSKIRIREENVMTIFNVTDEKMKETSSTFTLTEIHQQPSTWRKTCAQIKACKDELQKFIDQVVKQEDFDIVLTGAGTSEFVGNSLYQALNQKYNYKVKSFGTTDLVPSPECFLSATKPTILVRRSGLRAGCRAEGARCRHSRCPFRSRTVRTARRCAWCAASCPAGRQRRACRGRTALRSA